MKKEIISFKADPALVEQLNMINNKSEFIREAILSALKNTCPLCGGTGQLSSSQLKHWQEFSREHKMRQCKDCKEYYIHCERES